MEFALDATDDDVLAMVKEKRLAMETEKRSIERLLLINLQDKDKEEYVRHELEKFVGWCDSVRPYIGDPDCEISVQEKRQALAILGIVATIYPSDHDPRYTIEIAPTYIMDALKEPGFVQSPTPKGEVATSVSPA